MRLSRTTVDVAVRSLLEVVISVFGPTYLRQPTEDDLKKILRRNAERRLPGCIGSLDCCNWECRGCPKAHAGVNQDRKGRGSIVFETVCDEDLWI